MERLCVTDLYSDESCFKSVNELIRSNVQELPLGWSVLEFFAAYLSHVVDIDRVAFFNSTSLWVCIWCGSFSSLLYRIIHFFICDFCRIRIYTETLILAKFDIIIKLYSAVWFTTGGKGKNDYRTHTEQQCTFDSFHFSSYDTALNKITQYIIEHFP